MRTVCLVLSSLFVGGALWAEEPRVLPNVVQQLKRMEPLTDQKIQIFVEAGRLTPAQADLVRQYTEQGVLNLPAERVGAAQPVQAATVRPTLRGGLPRLPGGELDVLTILVDEDREPIRNELAADRQRLAGNLKGYRHVGAPERDAIRRDLQRLGPAANDLVGAAFTDPVDLDIKLELCAYLASAGNPRAAGYIALTHQMAMNKADPILIPYDTDAGGLIFRRQGGNEEPVRKFYSSRELREYVTELERLISHCPGPRAAIYLMSVYDVRYGGDEAPMRDKDRDRERMLRACGGDYNEMKDGDPKTWETTLAPFDRLLIAERLVPYLNHQEKDVREIARYGLLVVNGQPNKKLKDFFKDAPKHWGEVQNWWSQRREEMLKGIQ